MLANTCGVSVNGAMPTNGAPSPPIWVKVRVWSLSSSAMKWQPMPAVAKLPSGSRVEVPCGQPAQNAGMRRSRPGGRSRHAWRRRVGDVQPGRAEEARPGRRRRSPATVPSAATAAARREAIGLAADLGPLRRPAGGTARRGSATSTKLRFSSTTRIARLPRANCAQAFGLQRPGHRHLVERDLRVVLPGRACAARASRPRARGRR